MHIDGQGTPTSDDEILEEYPSNMSMKSSARTRRRLLLAIAGTVIVVVLVGAVSASVVVMANKDKTTSSETMNKGSSPGLDTEETVSKSLPTNSPTTSLRISSTPEFPTALPSGLPSWNPTARPSPMPSFQPTGSPTMIPVTTFYAVGDAPYSVKQEMQLTDQIGNIPDDAEFVVHIGDIRSADDGLECQRGEYEAIGRLLQNSRAPVFLVMGDNEWNGMCNRNEQGKF